MSRVKRKQSRGATWRAWLPYLASGAAIVLFVGWSILSSRAGAPPPVPTGNEAAQVARIVTTIPAEVLDLVGPGSVATGLTPTTLPVLKGPSGKPVVVYVGADFCPFCAAERWSLVVALSRFGTFRDLGLTTSSSSDVYPDTATFSFRGAAYTSDLIELSAVETADREGRPVATPDALQQAALTRSDPRGSVPFVSIADRYVRVGAGYSPDVLHGRTWSAIANELRDASSPVARAVLGNADRISAAICQVTSGAPSAVCASPAVRGLAP